MVSYRVIQWHRRCKYSTKDAQHLELPYWTVCKQFCRHSLGMCTKAPLGCGSNSHRYSWGDKSWGSAALCVFANCLANLWILCISSEIPSICSTRVTRLWMKLKKGTVETYRPTDIRWKVTFPSQTLPLAARLALTLAMQEVGSVSIEGRSWPPSCPVKEPSRSLRMAEWRNGNDIQFGALRSSTCLASTVNPPEKKRKKLLVS